MIHLITGGERSGKSRYSSQLALTISSCPIYLATARVWDKDFAARINRHQQERDSRWRNIEEEKNIGKLELIGETIVMDCVTLWLTNFYVDTKQDIERCLTDAKTELLALNEKNNKLIVITNEIGMGVHATTESGRKFVELQGWMNQWIAEQADVVTLMVSGIPVVIKGISQAIHE